MNHQSILQWEGQFLRVFRCGRWEYADRRGTTGAVAVVALTPDARLVLTEQYRIPVRHRVVELPAGLAGDLPGQAGEPLARAARRELLEETGYEAGRMTRSAAGPPSAGLSSEIVTFFLAGRLRRTGPGGGDPQEQIQVHEVPLARLDRWLRAKAAKGVMVDPKVYAGLYLLSRSPAAARRTKRPTGRSSPG